MLAEAAFPLYVAGAFAFGLAIGSFLNVVAYRLPEGRSIVRPGSHCPACQRALAAWENVPLLSYVVLRGRCRGCGARISLRYPAVELGTGLLFAAVALRHGLSPMAFVWMAFAAALVSAALVDLDHQIIPDEISLGGLAVGLLGVPWVRALEGAPLSASFAHAALGALVGGGLLWAVGFVHARVSVAFGRRFEHWPEEGVDAPRPGSWDYWMWFPGVGFGDVKLLAMIGAFVGPAGVLEVIIAAALLGLVGGLCIAALRGRLDLPFGFGPALAAGALLLVLAPPRLMSWISALGG